MNAIQLNITKHRSFSFVVLGAVIGLAFSAFFQTHAGSDPAASGPLFRLSADYETFGNPSEVFTNVAPLPGGAGGKVIYDKLVVVPADVNTLYVTISAVGDGHGGARLELACLVDGLPCNAGGNPIGDSPTGWLTALRHKDYNDNYAITNLFSGDGSGGAGDLHDNTVYYTWCMRVSEPGARHDVQVKLGSKTPIGERGGNVFLEAIHFFIDASFIEGEDQCSRVFPPQNPSGPGQGLQNGG